MGSQALVSTGAGASLDLSAPIIPPLIPTYKMTPQEREKFYAPNPTSKIDYPRGVPEIQKVLYQPKRSGLELIIGSYESVTKMIEAARSFIIKEHMSTAS